MTFADATGAVAEFNRRAVLGALFGEVGVEYTGEVAGVLSGASLTGEFTSYVKGLPDADFGDVKAALEELWDDPIGTVVGWGTDAKDSVAESLDYDFTEEDTQSFAYVAGWILAGFVPVLDAAVDTRDCLVLTGEAFQDTTDCVFAGVSIALSAGTILGAVSAPLTGGGGALLASGSVAADTVQSTARAVDITATAIKKGLVEPEQVVRWVYHKFPIHDLDIDFAGRVADKVGGRDATRVEEAAEKQQAHKIMTDGGFPDEMAAALGPVVRQTDATVEELQGIRRNLDAFDKIDDVQKQRALAKQLVTETDEPVDAAKRLNKLDADTLRYAAGRGAIDSMLRLLDRGVSPSRLNTLADSGIDLATHSRIVDELFERKNARVIKGADDAMEALANQRLRKITKSTESVKEELVIKTDTGNNIEIDSAIVNQDGEITAIGQVKMSDSPNSYYEAVGQLGENWKYITGERGTVTEIKTASGEIPPSNLDPDTVKEAYTFAPMGGNAMLPSQIPEEHTRYLPGPDELTIQNRRSYTYTLSDTKVQIEQGYETFKGARET